MTARRTLQLLISASRKVNSKRRVNFQAHSAFQTSSPQPLRIRNQVTASAKKNAIWIPGHNGLHFFRRCPASRVLLDNHPHHHPGNKIESGGGGNGRRKRVAMPSPRAFSADMKLELSQRSSPDQVKKEIQSCYELIQKLGRGAIYLGSSRVKDDHPHYIQAVELARDIARLLDCTTWTGAGPGLMDAAIKGALEAKKPVGGFKIAREAGEWSSSNFHPYLPSGSYITCRFFSARKHGLVDAAMRNEPSDMTAVVAFPGGIGTLDEAFEILALMQLERIGSELPVPFLLMNYDSFYSKLLEFFHECEKWGTVAEGEMAPLWKVCNGNGEALEYLANFYSIPQWI